MKAIARKFEYNGHRTWIVDSCPYCGKKHYHGAGYPWHGTMESFLGHRNAQCGKGGYDLVKEEDK